MGSFVVFVITWTILERLAEVLIGLRQTRLAILQYMINGLIRIAFASVLASYYGISGIFVSNALALTIALGLFLLFFPPGLVPRYRPIPNLQI